MSIIETAQKLAKEISENEVIIELQNARKAYLSNDDLASKAKEYMVQSAALQEEMNKGEGADKDAMVAIKDRMMVLADEVNKSEEIVRLREAEEKANAILSEISRLIETAVNGESEEEEGCSHDCSHCHGCH